MKKLFYILFLVSPLLIKGQETDKKTESPQIITRLKADKTMNFETKSIHFIKVLEDSRCPSDVSCVWAGQSRVLIGLYENNTLLEEKEIIIGANEISANDTKMLLRLGEKTIYGYNLSPYPSSTQKTNPSDYYLELLVK